MAVKWGVLICMENRGMSIKEGSSKLYFTGVYDEIDPRVNSILFEINEMFT